MRCGKRTAIPVAAAVAMLAMLPVPPVAAAHEGASCYHVAPVADGSDHGPSCSIDLDCPAGNCTWSVHVEVTGSGVVGAGMEATEGLSEPAPSCGPVLTFDPTRGCSAEGDLMLPSGGAATLACFGWLPDGTPGNTYGVAFVLTCYATPTPHA